MLIQVVEVSRAVIPYVTEDDHHPALSITLNASQLTYIGEKRSRKPNFFVAHYLELAARLALVNWLNLFASLDATACLLKFNEVLKQLIQGLPKSTGTNRHYPRWYSKQLIQLIGEKSKARKKRRIGKQSDIDEYRLLRRSVKQMIVECHDNTEDKLKSNSKCFFSYTKLMRKTNSLLVDLNHGDSAANDNV